MARLINFYLQDDNEEAIKNVGNRSQFINDLIREFHKKRDIKKMSVEELKKERDRLKAKKEYEKRLKEIEDGTR